MSDYAYEQKQMIDDSEYGYKLDLSKVPFETLLEWYTDYRSANIWEHPGFDSTFKFIQYGILLRHELTKRDKKGSIIL